MNDRRAKCYVANEATNAGIIFISYLLAVVSATKCSGWTVD